MTEDESESQIRIIIDAPWYFSKAAYAGYVIILALIIWGVIVLVQQISTKRSRLLAKKKEEELMKEQMEKDLKHKAQDLTASTMNVIRKNEILQSIDRDIEKVMEYLNEDRNKSLMILNGIRHDIRDNIQHDDIWQKFEDNFDIVYDDYLTRLGERFPQLTVSDKKMCAYLKINLSSKEIAPLMNLTVRSVEMTRHRLRKKLGLSRSESLTEFLHKF